MIKSFKHKGLERFFSSGNTRGIQVKHKDRLQEQLQALHTATVITDMAIPGWELHPLKGKYQSHWSIKVSANWRIVFRFKEGHAYVVDYEDYH